MSWFLLIKEDVPKLAGKFSSLYKHSKKYSLKNISLFFEENKKTLQYNFSENYNSYIISGLAVSAKYNGYKFLSTEDWNNFLSSGKNVNELNGHFAAAVFSENKIVCFNDIFGLREVYYAKENNSVIISTRSDLISSLLKKKTINDEYIPGLWYSSTQFYYRTPVKEIKRLGPGGKIEINSANNIVYKRNKYIPPSNLNNADNFASVLNELTLFPLKENVVSLGLSGGLDSRTLLSIIGSSGKNNWSMHTFGNNNLPDVKTAERIAEIFPVDYKIYNQQPENADKILSFVKNYIPFSGLTVPFSDLLHIEYHKMISGGGKMIIDGGFGEIGRRQFLNRFLLKGKNSLSGKNTPALLQAAAVSKPDIFKDETAAEFHDLLLHASENVWGEMEDVSVGNAGGWADMLMVRFKLPNVYSYGQHTLDQVSAAYMPFAQKDFLDINFSVKPYLKRNGKLYRKIISDNNKQLEKLELVKNGISYSYGLGTISSHLLRKLKTKISPVNMIDPVKFYIFDTLKDYIYDEINSVRFKNHNYTDSTKITGIVETYYKGNTETINDLDWWFTFNEWYKIYFEN